MSTTVDAPRATRREWAGLAVLALPCVLYSMDLTVLNLAVPRLTGDLQPSSAQLLWIVDIYGFLVAGFLITMGTLGDRIGRRRLLLVGATAFAAASVLAAYAASAGMLIAARALLGVAAATLAPSTLALLRNMFADPHQRTVAIGVWITSFSVGSAIGPLAGGLLLGWFWWGSVFLIAVPVMVLLLMLGPLLLPESRNRQAGRLDLPSVALSLAAVLAVIYGLKQLAQTGPGWPPALAMLAGLGAGVVFVRRQRALGDPLVDLGLFRVPAFGAALVTNTFSFFVAFGSFFYLAQYLQLVLGLTPLGAGVWTVPSAAGFIVGSLVTPPLVGRVRPGLVMAGGLVLAAAGFGLLTRVGPAAGLAVAVPGSVVVALGLAPVFTLATDLMVGSAPPERAGAAAGIAETSSEFGGALGIAVLGSLLTAVYRSQVADTVPAGVPTQVAAAARDTLGGAVAAAGQLPGQVGTALLDAAREAFTHGVQAAAASSAVVAVAVAVLAATLLRSVRADTEPERPPDHPGPGGPCAAKVGAMPAPAIMAPRPTRGQAPVRPVTSTASPPPSNPTGAVEDPREEHQ